MNLNILDSLNKLDNINVTSQDKISKEDKDYCITLNKDYDDSIKLIQNFFKQSIELYNNQKERMERPFIGRFDEIEFAEKRFTNIKEKFIGKITSYFSDKYNVKINDDQIIKKYKDDSSNTYNIYKEITYQNIVDEIMLQLDGFSFEEKSIKEVKDALYNKINTYKGMNMDIKNKKVILNSFFYIDSFDRKWGTNKLSYNSREDMEVLFKAISHFENNTFELNKELESIQTTITQEQNGMVFTTHEFQTLNKIKSIKLYKSNRLDIEFINHELAEIFCRDYLGYIEGATPKFKDNK